MHTRRHCLIAATGGVALGAQAAKPAGAQVVRWVYPERNKWPFIADAPSSAGFYEALFQRAASAAGLALAVDRVPKARAWRQLEQGESDFYPGASFSEDRSRLVVWLDTGMRTREVCLLRPGLRLQGPLASSKGLAIAVEPGSSKIEQFPQHQVQHFGSRLTIDRAVDLLVRERVDLVVVDIEPLAAYQARVEEGSLARLGITVDENCIGPWLPLQLAWSRAALVREGATGLPPPASRLEDQAARLPPNSKAARFHRALLQLKTRGEMARLALKHGLPPPP
jgi:ABC-type amino acid transport substrate-binding protein